MWLIDRDFTTGLLLTKYDWNLKGLLSDPIQFENENIQKFRGIFGVGYSYSILTLIIKDVEGLRFVHHTIFNMVCLVFKHDICELYKLSLK